MFRIVLICSLLTTVFSSYAQTDSLIFTNGNYIVGEIKSMDLGIIGIETDYSDSDFSIEWEGIQEIHTTSVFLITLSDGRRYHGPLRSVGDGQIEIIRASGDNVTVPAYEIVYLNSIDDTFLSRLSASFDLGFSFTKARNLRQFNFSLGLGYLAEKWALGMDYSFVASNQDEVDRIQRGDGSATFQYFLPKDWYALASLSLLSSTEMMLNLRTTTKVGLGKYLIHTNQTYWGVAAGLNFNNEDYYEEDARQSLEGYLGTELNMYDVGDLNLTARVAAYPSFTESGRWRMDIGINSKYDLPLDFYLRAGFTLNYDNQPVEGAGTTDYTFQFGVGWEL